MTSNATQYTWAGRFSEPVSDLVKRYTASVDFDQRMWRQDIRGSLAHARMLAKQGIIAAADLALPTSQEFAVAGGDEPDRATIEAALDRNGGVLAQAAADLGLSRQALYRRLDRLGIARN